MPTHEILADVLADATLSTTRQLLLLVGPFALLALGLRAVETSLSRRLVSRLGFRSVLVTGWLGVPVHELSHVVACVLFGHTVERVQFFAPDARTATLGSVRHAWNPHNPWAQIGRLVIGVAPLLGGSAVLWTLARTLGPASASVPALEASAGWQPALDAALAHARDLGAALLRADTWTTWRTWLFLYLALCVGTHLAPSGADLRGSRVGLLAFGLALMLANAIAAMAGGDPRGVEAFALRSTIPVLTLLALALVLGLLELLVVFAVTAPLGERRRG
ncbi:MAG: hypothetical protein H6825_00800 [Planctomycetes bacterium]|nr:hypothetical protein [Planctomycetota bacterium]